MFSIRFATTDDSQAIHRVHRRSIASLHPRQSSPEAVSRWVARRTVEDLLREMAAECFVVAEEDRQILGFAALDARKAEITSVFVDPRHARKGVGRALVGDLEGRARDGGLAAVRLMATGSAIDFYRKVGFTRVRGSDREPSWAEMRKEL